MIELATKHPWRDMFAVLTDVTADDAARWLTPFEVERAESFRLERRREEWRASRVAARLATSRICGVEPEGVGLEESQGSSVAIARGRRLHVSYSHSGSFGAAAVAAERTGIDIERIRPVERRLTKFFLSAGESEILDACGIDDSLIHFWSAKEAAFKCFGAATLLSQLRIDDVTCSGDGVTLRATFEASACDVVTIRCSPLVIAVARIVPSGGSVLR